MSQKEQPQTPRAQTRRDIEAQITAKAWKEESFKQELLTNPKSIFEQEFGVQLPAEINVQVIEENPTSLHFVIPMRPQVPGHELNEEELETIAGGRSVTVEMLKESAKITIGASFAVFSFQVTKDL